MKKNNRFIISIFFIFALLIFCNILLKQKDNNVLETFRNQNISNKQYVYPLGNIVGIKADTDGALVIGFEEDDIEYIGGLKIGDNIISIEGEKINNYKDISNVLNKLRLDEVEIIFERNVK